MLVELSDIHGLNDQGQERTPEEAEVGDYDIDHAHECFYSVIVVMGNSTISHHIHPPPPPPNGDAESAVIDSEWNRNEIFL